MVSPFHLDVSHPQMHCLDLLLNGNPVLGMRAVLGGSAPVDGLFIIPRAN
jgi:hypothetical protein